MTIPQREGKENVSNINNELLRLGKKAMTATDLSYRELYIAEKLMEIDALKSLLKSAHEIIKKLEYSKPDYDGIRDECNFCNECEYTNRHSADCCVGKWLSDYERAIRGE